MSFISRQGRIAPVSRYRNYYCRVSNDKFAFTRRNVAAGSVPFQPCAAGPSPLSFLTPVAPPPPPATLSRTRFRVPGPILFSLPLTGRRGFSPSLPPIDVEEILCSQPVAERCREPHSPFHPSGPVWRTCCARRDERWAGGGERSLKRIQETNWR